MTLLDLAIKNGADNVYLENLLQLVHHESTGPTAQADELEQLKLEMLAGDLPNPNNYFIW